MNNIKIISLTSITLCLCILLTACNRDSQQNRNQDCTDLNEICFEDVSEILDLPNLDDNRVRYTGQTWSLSWGDANNNEWPDLYLNHHTDRSTNDRFPTSHLIYDLGQNTEDWQFTELYGIDQHSALFIDLDMDGKQDILEISGGMNGQPEFYTDPNTANVVFLGSNWSDTFKQKAKEIGLDFTGRRGRTAIPINQNGILKLLFLNEPREDHRGPSVLVRRDEYGNFTEEAAINFADCSGADCEKSGFNICKQALTLHINEDNDTDIVCFGPNTSGVHTLTVFLADMSASRFAKAASMPAFNLKDGVVADINNDGKLEIIGIIGRKIKVMEFNSSNGKSIHPQSRNIEGLNKNKCSVPIALVGGDFDNDLDIDLLVYHKNCTQEFEISIWTNNGAGKFKPSTFKKQAHKGIARNVSVADFNLDGSLDVLFSNGKGTPEEAIELGGGYILWQGVTKGNWLEVDLRDKHGLRGLGARVSVLSSDVTITRGQYGGVHGEVQDFDRLHFGIKDLEMVDVAVQWADGDETLLTNVMANQIITIRQDDEP